MGTKNEKNIVISGSNNKSITLDVCYDTTLLGKRPIVLYAHGFNGFKDWGNFDLIAEQFALQGFTFIKFNFSHNGTTVKQPMAFADLEAFGHNNYTKQLYDLQCMMSWICNTSNQFAEVMDTNKIGLVGHSMGGGIAILFAAVDERIKALITWAAISECKTPWGNWPAERIDAWKKSGVEYYVNGRTKQNMPLYYQLFEDFEQNKEKLNIQKAIAGLDIPVLICHGNLDTSVPMESAVQLWKSQPKAELFTVDSDHVFGRKHPWEDTVLPFGMQLVTDKNLQFLKDAFK